MFAAGTGNKTRLEALYSLVACALEKLLVTDSSPSVNCYSVPAEP